MQNWAGSYEFTAASVARPRTIDELRSVVAAAPKAHALGSAHSFHDLADTSGTLIATAALPFEVSIDSERSVARVSAGARYGDIAPVLDAAGFALSNLASLPHISVAGTVATGTHGSGDRNQTLSAAVRGLELVTATGDVERIDDDRLPGAVVSLGGLGIVTSVDLALVPRFEVAQTVYGGVALDAYLDDFDAVTALGYSVSAFTNFEPGLIDSIWVKARTDAAPAPAEVLGAAARRDDRHVIDGEDVGATTPQGGVPGPWFERLPHFRLAFTPSAGEEVQSEYLLPRTAAREAIEALYSLADLIRPLLIVSEIRTMAADDLWLSGANGRDTVGLHFTWHRRVPEVTAVLPAIERVLLPLGARPHWGKLFVTPDPFALHPDASRFVALAESLDAGRKFRGPFLDRYLG